jgi:hypothetical protein
MDDKREFRKPGRGGYTQRRGIYGMARGYNSRNFGGHTWTFYETEQWDKFQNWMKEEKTKKKQEETKMIIEGIAELMDNKFRKRKERNKGKKKMHRSDDEDSDASSSEPISEYSDPESYKRSPKKKAGRRRQNKEWREKKMTKGKGPEPETKAFPLQTVLDSLGRIEERIKGVEIRNNNMESEIKLLRSKNDLLEERNKLLEEERNKESENEDMSRYFERIDEEKSKEDKWRDVQSRFKGKEGTAELKKWCLDNEVPYKNKENAMMAVIALEGQED